MLSEREVSTSFGSTAYGANGDKLGTVESFFVDDRTGAPTWVAVLTGLFGTRQSIVPALDATFTDGQLRLPVAADAVKRAPRLTVRASTTSCTRRRPSFSTRTPSPRATGSR